MKTITIVRPVVLLAVLATLATLLAACSEQPESTEPAATDPGPVPVGRLASTVTPEHYRLELRINPREDRFSGVTSIDLRLAEATSNIWLHGKNLDVSEAYLVDGDGNPIAASYEQRDDTGVALVMRVLRARFGSAPVSPISTRQPRI